MGSGCRRVRSLRDVACARAGERRIAVLTHAELHDRAVADGDHTLRRARVHAWRYGAGAIPVDFPARCLRQGGGRVK